MANTRARRARRPRPPTLIPAPLDEHGRTILWPAPSRGLRTPVTREVVETILTCVTDDLGLTSRAALADAIDCSSTLAGRWMGGVARMPSRAMLIRMIYLCALYKSQPNQWWGEPLRELEWGTIHLFGLPYAPYKPLTEPPLDPLFEPRGQFPKRASWRSFETVLTFTLQMLGLGTLARLARALHISSPTCQGWVLSGRQGPSHVALLKILFLWILHLEDQRRWRGRRLASFDWRHIHEYGLGYRSYEELHLP